jgi:ABC-2 type transport system ATP-binding protein
VLVANQLSKHYGNQTVLQNLNFTIQPGEALCLLGANGAGKTTCINLFLGLTSPSSGSASVNGIKVHEQSEKSAQDIFYLPENVALYESLNALENLQYFCSLAKLKKTEKELRNALEQVGLDSMHYQKRLTEYSKGMRQKVAIAFAILKNAKALLLDEPTSGLDPVATRDFILLIQRLKAKGAAVLMVTHDLYCADVLADTIYIMDQGKVLKQFKNTGDLHQIEQFYFSALSSEDKHELPA